MLKNGRIQQINEFRYLKYLITGDNKATKKNKKSSFTSKTSFRRKKR